MPRGVWLILLALLIGVLVTVLPLPGLIHTLGYLAGVIVLVIGVVFLIVDLMNARDRGPRGPVA